MDVALPRLLQSQPLTHSTNRTSTIFDLPYSICRIASFGCLSGRGMGHPWRTCRVKEEEDRIIGAIQARWIL